MPTYFQRPENALKRANEFISVGKEQRALDALYDVIKSKKHRTWGKEHEQIMQKYLSLCVDLKKSHVAKEGLYQYKNICQQVNIGSLIDVVRQYIALAESKTEAARLESHQTVVDIDDLDVPDTPESLLLKAVSGEDTQDRTDRAILTPWVKFLWESYRQCLDLLRNNSKLERLYQDIAQQAFKFCLKYSRKTEFRKLCDNLRTHLGHIHKHQHQQTAINLNNPESQEMHLKTRLVQLDNAINMELWQEAYKAVEDIHGLINLSKKSPKPSLMANYYQKLGLVFWKSGSRLFHACTLHRVFHLSREQRKNLTKEELQKMASGVVCATLAIPIQPTTNAIGQVLAMDDSAMEKQRHLATLLMLQNPPTRQGLIKDLVKSNVLQHLDPELVNLYRWLEVEFHPLSLYSRVVSSLEFIEQNENLSQYVPALHDIVITRVLKQVSQVYQTVSFSRIASLVPFASQFHLERIIVDAAKTLDLQVRIDHRSQSLSFGTDLGVSQKEDVPEGPYIQSMPSEHIRNQLMGMSHALNKALSILRPTGNQMEKDDLRSQIINNYRMTAKKEHQRILQRQRTIEDRKEQLENMTQQIVQEEQEQQEEQRRKAYEAEMARLDREAKQRERQRQQDEHKEIQKRHAKERIEQLKKSEVGAKVLQNIDEQMFADLDVDEIMAKQVEQLEKEKRELNERLKAQEKKVDHYARAKRIEEIPLLETQYDEQSLKDKEFWDLQEVERIKQSSVERELAIINRDRLSRMRDDKDEFLDSLSEQRRSHFKDKQSKFDKMLAEEKKRRLQERKTNRKEERRQKWMKEREEAEQKARDEELKREREEKERIEIEIREQEEKDYQDQIAKREEQTAIQRQKEMEIEEREAKRKEESREGWRSNAPQGGGWREREKQRLDSFKDRHDGDSGPPPSRDETDGSWRSRMPARDEREAPRDDGGPWSRGPPQEDRGPPPATGESWRSRDTNQDDRGPSRDAWRSPRDDQDSLQSRGPPRDDRGRDEQGGWRSRGESGGAWRGGEERRPRDEDGGSWRRAAPARDDARDEDGGSGWRSRAPPRDDREEERSSWRSHGPPQEDRGGYRGSDGDSWRSRDPPRDDRGPPRDDRGPPRDDRGAPRDDRGPPRDDRGPPRDDRGPLRDDRVPDQPRDDQGAWRSSGTRDDLPPPAREEGGAWRSTGSPKSDAAPSEGGWRARAAAQQDKGPPADDRGPSRDDRGPRRDDGGPRRDEGAWGSRALPRDDDSRGWRGREDSSQSQTEAPRDFGGGGGWREREREKADTRPAPTRDGGGGSWRDRERQKMEDARPAPVRDGGGGGGSWRDREREKAGKPPGGEEDEGWTTVHH